MLETNHKCCWCSESRNVCVYIDPLFMLIYRYHYYAKHVSFYGRQYECINILFNKIFKLFFLLLVILHFYCLWWTHRHLSVDVMNWKNNSCAFIGVIWPDSLVVKFIGFWLNLNQLPEPKFCGIIFNMHENSTQNAILN